MNTYGSFDYVPEQECRDDVLFENTHSRDKQFFSEFYTYSYFTRRPMIILYSLMALYLVVTLVDLFLTGDCFWGTLWLLPLFLLFVLFMRALSVNASVKRELENGNGTPILYTIQFTDRKICLQTSLGTKMEIDLSMIRSVAQAKSYLLLQTAAKQVYPVKKDAFVKGSYEEFCVFLRSKNFKVKIKK
ncbi:MAG: YcxB family protein [Ruminococcaceae bacterium]|nr:YcxB family protein [Oscillospiraceae bacterium]